MQNQHIDKAIRSDIRYFAFWIGNGSLLPSDFDADFDYEPYLMQKNDAFGQVFAIYLNNLRTRQQGVEQHDPFQRAAQWLLSYCDPKYHVELPFEPWEIVISDTTKDIFATITSFALMLGHGLLDPDILCDIDYVSCLFEGGSFLEGIFAVFTNVLQIDADGYTPNTIHARHRTAQFIRQYLDKDYHANPSFEQWELELH